MTTQHLSREIATFAANLKAADIPEDVMDRAEDLLIDWFGSAIAGKGSRPVELITQFAQNMDGFDAAHVGPSEILVSRKTSSPFLAAMANAAASYVAKQDDVHNGSARTQSAGLWEFLRDAADSKQLHTAHAQHLSV
jgi:2-methylcitrate dehydratase PrpD